MIQQRAARFVPTRDSVSTMLVDRISETDELTHNMSCPSKSWQNQAEVKISFLAYILKAWSNYTMYNRPRTLTLTLTLRLVGCKVYCIVMLKAFEILFLSNAICFISIGHLVLMIW